MFCPAVLPCCLVLTFQLRRKIICLTKDVHISTGFLPSRREWFLYSGRGEGGGCEEEV